MSITTIAVPTTTTTLTTVTVPTKAEFDALTAKVTALTAQQNATAAELVIAESRISALESAPPPVAVPPPVVVPPPPSGGFHEPTGLTLIDATDWTADVGSWWRNFNSADKPITTLVVPDGPNGQPSPVLQIGYKAGMAGGGGTELGRWIQPGVQELYWRYPVRVNPTWQGHTSGINKMVYINDAGAGGWAAIWYVMYGGGANPLGFYAYNQSGQDIGWVGTQQTPIFSRGVWSLVEIHQVQGQPGRVRVWVDGVQRLDTPAVTKANPIGLIVISGIWGGVGDMKQHDDWMQFGPVYVSGR